MPGPQEFTGGGLVIRANNWVGDLVMATPVLEAAVASEHWSDVHILVRAHLAPLLKDGPLERHVVTVTDGPAELAALRELAASGTRAALLLSNSLGAAWRAWRAGIPLRAGAALSGRRFLLTHAVVPPTEGGRRSPIPTAHLMRDVAGLLGIFAHDLHPRLAVRDEVASNVRARLAESGVQLRRSGNGPARGPGEGPGYVLCCPGAAFGAAKLWPAESFATTLDRLAATRGLVPVLTGAPGEVPLLEAVAARCVQPAVVLADLPHGLEGLKAVVREAAFVLVGDSGPRWLAAAFDVPCVSVMGPNFPELTASSLERCEVVRVEGLECSPCLQRSCPLEHHRCMRDLAPEAVLAAAERVLGSTATNPGPEGMGITGAVPAGASSRA